MNRITVIIPCFNDASYVRECLASVLAQTRPVDEVLLVDDCSTDGSGDIARSFGGPVRVISPAQNGGCAASRNLGIDQATGNLIAFLDADDYFAPDHIATLEGLLDRHPDADIAFSLLQLFGDHDNVWWRTIDEDVTVDAFWECVQKPIAGQSATMVRAPVVKETARFDGRMRHAEDFDFWLKVSGRHRFVCSYRVTAYYRKYPEQTSRDVIQCKRAEFSVRKEFWAQAQRSGSPEYLEALRHAMNRAWERHLIDAWNRRRPDLMDFYLSLGDSVPSSGRLERVWRRRRRYMPMLGLWDHIPGFARDLVKRFVRRPVEQSAAAVSALGSVP